MKAGVWHDQLGVNDLNALGEIAAAHHLAARFDPEGLAQFFARIDS